MEHGQGDFSACTNLTVLYLHNNNLERIENLEHAVNLTHLYLQDNKIRKIENLDNLTKLRKLYLSKNSIAVIEGLESQKDLHELHVEKQKLPKGESLYFDPRTIKTLSKCLHILNVSGNGLHSIADLMPLYQLTQFMAKNNNLDNTEEILQTVGKWPVLHTLEMDGNPISKRHKYRESLIAVSARLELLDGKAVSETTREFLQRLELTKMERRLKGSKVDNTLHTITADIDNLTKHFPAGVKKSISRAILRDGHPKPLGKTEVSQTSTFPAWNIRVSETTYNYKKSSPMIPRPFWRQRKTTSTQRTCSKKLEEHIHLPKL
ncbi:protein phosphatase 1 regulatory subunit 42 [Anabrus simplex]|uniref:protein phosphatase 1 regulatory subunit 42 n=1 Tax=Anabrus simplex TaxID=316456 RepID=UPI0035A32094